jgi:hypothetical protein
MKHFPALARTPVVVARALRASVVVGTVRILINLGDVLLAGMAPNWIKIALTYLVPSCVSMHKAIGAMREPRNTSR